MAATALALARSEPSIDPEFLMECLCARAEARAWLWFHWQIADLQHAVDPLWRWAVERGLVAAYGVDEVQAVLARAFAPYRGDLSGATS